MKTLYRHGVVAPTLRSGAALALVAAVAACGASGASPDGSGQGGSGPPVTGPFGTGPGGTGSGGGPPEQHVESSYGAPVATSKYVWIANPTSGRVAYIDASTLEIKLVDAGDAPTYLAAVPDPVDDVAIVLNVLSLDATVLRASASGLSAVSVPVFSAGNAWSVSGDGHWAISWTDAHRISMPDPVEGYQDLTVIDLTPGAEASVDLSVGYRPVAVAFDAKSQRAFAVTQDGISVIALTGGPPAVIKNIAVAANSAEAAASTAVAITPDGGYALVRRDGIATASVFSLADGMRTDVVLPGVPTDLVVSGDGATGVAVVRDMSKVALLPIPGIVSAPTSFVTVAFDTTVGSAILAPKSPVGLFFTSGMPNPVLSVMDTSAAMPAPHDILLRAAVLGVFPTPDASYAAVLHDALTEQGSHYPAAVSLAPIALGLPPKIVGLDAPVVPGAGIAVSPAGDHALVAAGDESKGVYELMLASMPSLAIVKLPLASLPIAAGIVAGAGRGYVAQKYPDGRITFIDLATGKARTLTGFELATQVVDGTP
jgi:hypothetical protein